MRTAGWYSDPQHRFDRRYWDGQAWTPRVRDRGSETVDSGRTAHTQQNAVPQDQANLVLAAYITAVLISPVGFFVGFALLLKGRTWHGIAAMVLSLLVLASLASVA